jgi:1,4-dihydroxy-2-naphthoate octaprenyltransferase
MTENPNERNKAIRFIKLLLFSASIIPSIIAGSIIYYEHNFCFINWFLVLLGLFIGQAGGDYLYYYFTHLHSDLRDSHTKIFAGWRPLFADSLTQEKGTLYAGIVCLILDLAIGSYFTYIIGYQVIIFAMLGGLVAIFFTPLMLRGWKEPVIFITFGPLCLAGAYFVLTHQLNWTPVIASLPIAFFVTVVAYLKGAHFEVKSDGDSEIVLKLNKKRIYILFFLGYLSLILAVIFDFMPLWTLLGLISFPIMFSVIKAISNSSSRISDYLWAVVRSLLILIISGILIAVGYLIKKINL